MFDFDVVETSSAGLTIKHINEGHEYSFYVVENDGGGLSLNYSRLAILPACGGDLGLRNTAFRPLTMGGGRTGRVEVRGCGVGKGGA